MAKNKPIQYKEFLSDIDLSHENESLPDEIIAQLMEGLMQASSNQLQVAIELTKLIVEKSAGNLTEEKIFSLFQRANKVIAEHMPFHGMGKKWAS